LYFVFKIQYCFQSVLSRNILGKTVNYKNLFKSTDVTRIGLIGTGAFGKSFLAQSRLTPGIRVAVVCDQDIETAEDACLQSGLAPEDLKICHTESEANDTIASGKTAVISDALLLMDLPIEVVIEATGMPEVGAIHARSAIENGKHVVMVTKESDCVVGPILNRLAEKAGVVYTPADGDQPSLLIGLISWAETLGFEIVCAGKAGELDFVYDRDSNTIARGNLKAFAVEDLWELAGGSAEQGIRLRRRVLESLPQFSVADLCEMVVVINSTGYDYDAPQLHAPIARIIEMPEILCGRDDGGILQKEGIIDMVNCLRRSDEISFAGGVFVIVKCRGRETWQFLKAKGHLVNRAGTHAMIFRPYHLLGVETATSVLAARYLKLSTGGIDPKPRVDVGLRATRTLPQGYRLTLGSDHAIAGVLPEILPAKKMASDSPVPYYMAAGNSLKLTVEEDRLLTYGMIAHDSQSCLWQLRQEQDTIFGM
jgi:predicted homoserine dehydrogenase-like protein